VGPGSRFDKCSRRKIRSLRIASSLLRDSIDLLPVLKDLEWEEEVSLVVEIFLRVDFVIALST